MSSSSDIVNQIERITILPNSLALWGLGQMGFVVKGPDAVLYIDPCLSYILPSRAFPPPIDPNIITHADYVLCSHEHIDHFDSQTLIPLMSASPDAKLITTRWCLPMVDEIGLSHNRVIFPTAFEPMTLPNTTCTITALPSAHYGLDHHPEKGYRWLGFTLAWNGIIIYFAGDTIIYEGYVDMLKKQPRANIAILPVNGRDYFREQRDLTGNLHPNEASGLARELNWDVVLMGHNDMLPGNTIPMGAIAQAFADECPQQAYKMLKAGELLYYIR